MKICVESIFPCSAKWLFREVQKTESFFYVTKPIMKFVPHRCTLGELWKEGKYPMNMHLFGFLPMGKQWIVIELDSENMQMRDNGRGQLIDKWDHRIRVEPLGQHRAGYQDIIEIEAGGMTGLISLYARFFYRYRQFRWKQWIKKRYPHRTNRERR